MVQYKIDFCKKIAHWSYIFVCVDHPNCAFSSMKFDDVGRYKPRVELSIIQVLNTNGNGYWVGFREDTIYDQMKKLVYFFNVS